MPPATVALPSPSFSSFFSSHRLALPRGEVSSPRSFSVAERAVRLAVTSFRVRVDVEARAARRLSSDIVSPVTLANSSVARPVYPPRRGFGVEAAVHLSFGRSLPRHGIAESVL